MSRSRLGLTGRKGSEMNEETLDLRTYDPDKVILASTGIWSYPNTPPEVAAFCTAMHDFGFSSMRRRQAFWLLECFFADQGDMPEEKTMCNVPTELLTDEQLADSIIVHEDMVENQLPHWSEQLTMHKGYVEHLHKVQDERGAAWRQSMKP